MSEFDKDTNVPTNDCISRQALKNALINWQMEYAEKGKDVERFDTLGKVIDLVEQMPTTDEQLTDNNCVVTINYDSGTEQFVDTVTLPVFSQSVQSVDERDVKIKNLEDRLQRIEDNYYSLQTNYTALQHKLELLEKMLRI